MNLINFHPAKRYLLKLYLKGIPFNIPLALFAISIFAQRNILNTPVSSLRQILSPIIAIYIGLQLLIWFAMTLYYFSIRYEILADEVVVRSGILTRTVKHVPFRTITNITTNRDILDQIIGTGSLSIQTAGTGSTIPEEKLVGIVDLKDLYEYVARQLRRFRSGLSANQADSDENVNEVMVSMLVELRTIRRILEQR
jgi:uncharacterized membrane protein YdbT with pleckstrin-like domain